MMLLRLNGFMFLGKLYRLFTISSFEALQTVVQNLHMVVRTKRVTPRTYTFVNDIFKVNGVLDSPLNSQNCMAQILQAQLKATQQALRSYAHINYLKGMHQDLPNVYYRVVGNLFLKNLL